ncbi:hypothetical protein [Paenibacillus sp. JDR-2]|uniref:hypothetical protein n=1 Tax=Paenibacillus sp. (strain JDR-2) TaxID=324057 RepID=UPI000166865D|nr:hypothetical protein [Paenibacillus sp. JDR-2]ACT01394.1 hypothetical protein Pjdr2_2741 [Paenibacillus sp. JDR-2]
MDHLIILLIFLAGAYMEYRVLMKKRQIREIAVSASFLTVGVVLVLLQQLQVKLPSPIMGINAIFKPIDLFMSNLLK